MSTSVDGRTHVADRRNPAAAAASTGVTVAGNVEPVYTGQTVYDPDSDLELLSDLAVACVGGHTRVAFARHVAEALAAHSRLRRLEVAWSTDHEASAVEVVPARGSWHVAHEGPPRAAARIAEAVAAGRPVARPGRSRHATLALPLFEDGVPVGAVVLTLASPDARWSRHALLRAVGAVLLAGHRACRTIERVAAASLRAHQDNASLRRRLDAEGAVDVVARSAAMLDALRRSDLAAAHEVTVLLRGESGTGKGVLARRIHARSPRAGGPFVHVDCAALPEALVESELFGHEAGAFTGATRRHVGKVERAAGGTLFLDEVGELPASAQAKLLRLLQDGTFERVGGERELRARARIVAATHRPLEQMITEGRWRADLFHRLAVFPIVVPPLRERPDDVPALVDAALARAATRLAGRVRPRMASDALARLVRHEWPGNVREVENLVERAAILASGEPIDARVLADAGLGAAPATTRAAEADGSDEGAVMTLEVATRAALVRALRAAEGRIYGPRGAAALLGLRPSTLQTKMIAHGLRRAAFVPRE